ncbi:hypothetical protein DMUE_1096 [Dictyocoela muelleri]|nr:hypothetical protein DMUE_1096 [Dictyocoela muelleri]
MEDLESLLKNKYGTDALPKYEIENYFKILIKNGQINKMPTFESLIEPMNLESLKKFADKFKKKYKISDNSLNDKNDEKKENNCLNEENDESFHTCNEFNKLKERTKSIIGKRSKEDNMEILRNVLNNYFKYEKMKMEKIESDFKYKKFLIVGVGFILLIVLLYFISNEKPY